MAKLPNRLVIEIADTDKVDELGNPVISFESKDYAKCVIEELEKIKAEINNFIGGMNMGDDLDNETFKKLDIRIEDIFDDHISELKGETNELER